MTGRYKYISSTSLNAEIHFALNDGRMILWGFRNFDSCLRTFYTILLRVESIFREPPGS
jgi:hypothetical protein